MRAWMGMTRTLVALAALALAPAGGVRAAPAAASAADVPQVGQKAPDVQLPGSDGKGHWLRSYRGKKNVVLAFFPKANTSG
jgi:thioredoxin-dependent peroxiredoxin